MFDVLYELRLRELYERKDVVSAVQARKMLPAAATEDTPQEVHQETASQPRAEAA